jgi:hypothetical protein
VRKWIMEKRLAKREVNRCRPKRPAIALAGAGALALFIAGCAAPVRGAGNVAQSMATTSVTAAKATGTLLKKAVMVPVQATQDAWQQAAKGRAPEMEPPTTDP